MLLRRWTLVWFVLALTLSSTNLFAAAPAAAEPQVTATCYGASCNGLDPLSTDCMKGAVLVASYYGLSRYYSPTCNAYYGYANWAWQGTYTQIQMQDDTNGSTLRSGWVYSIHSGMWATGQVCVASYDRGFWCV